jgi:hypothetical protein
MARNALVLAALAVAGASAVAAAAADDFTFSAKVGKTEVELGTPITLVLSLTGDVAGIQLPKIELPEGFTVGATSQATNFALQHGVMQRSVGLTYVILPQRDGAFQLGPFTVRRGKDEYRTEPIHITVTKPPVPRDDGPAPGERFLL